MWGLQADDAPCYIGLKGFPVSQDFWGIEWFESREWTMWFVSVCLCVHSYWGLSVGEMEIRLMTQPPKDKQKYRQTQGATGRNLQSKLIEKEERRKRRRRIWNTLTTALIHCINFSAGHRTTSGGWLAAKHYSVFIEKGNSTAQAPVLYWLAPEKKKTQQHV